MAEMPERCKYCLEEPDHECCLGEPNYPEWACCTCCGTHGGLTLSDLDAYEWVSKIVAKHNQSLSTAEARIRELEQEREWARVALGAGIVERDKAQAQLQAVTQERDEWQDLCMEMRKTFIVKEHGV